MLEEKTQEQQAPEKDDGDLTDLINELRVLLPGTQTLVAFLIILPFNSSFSEIRNEAKTVYVITFLCTVVALILFSAPAAHHRLQRPLRDREAFKDNATRLMIAGLVPLSVALVLSSQLVLSMVLAGRWIPWLIAGAIALGILLLWWVFPIMTRDRTGRK